MDGSVPRETQPVLQAPWPGGCSQQPCKKNNSIWPKDPAVANLSELGLHADQDCLTNVALNEKDKLQKKVHSGQWFPTRGNFASLSLGTLGNIWRHF